MKILMRTSMWPEGIFTSQEIIAKDRIGSNIGNMLFPYSVGRWVQGAGEDIQIDPIRDAEVAGRSAKKINDNYDMMLLPFANAFRKEFMPFVNQWTTLIKKLTIPCIVVGIGAQANLGEADNFQFAFDKDTLAFCEAVLEKSNSIGVRGEITKKYLVRIGVPEEKVRVIGCPSMFVHGTDFIPIKKKPFEEIGKMSLNTSKKNVEIPLITEWLNQYPEAEFVSQETWELILLSIGYQNQTLNNGYFVQKDHEFVQKGRVHSFVDTMSWLSYLHQYAGLSAGTRIHGNVAAFMAGIPALVIACDTRVKEICDFFAVPYRTIPEVEANRSLKDWYEVADFEPMNERYPKAMEIYEDFFKENKIPYKVPTERLQFLDKSEINDITSCYAISREEHIERVNQYCAAWEDRMTQRDLWRQGQIKNVRKVLNKERAAVKEERETYQALKEEKQSYQSKFERLDHMSVAQFIKYKLKRKTDK